MYLNVFYIEHPYLNKFESLNLGRTVRTKAQLARGAAMPMYQSNAVQTSMLFQERWSGGSETPEREMQ